VNIFKRPLDLALWAIFITSLAILFLAHEDPFVRDALCSRTGFCPVVANAKAWNKIFYDLAVGALVALFFYLLVVRLPDYLRRRRLKRNLRRHYRAFREDCIQIMLAVTDHGYTTELSESLMNQQKFRAYFDENVADRRTRWDEFINNVNEFWLNELLINLQTLRDEVAFILNNVDIPSEDPFEFLKRLSAAIYSMKDITLDYDELKSLGRFLWTVFAGWDIVDGYRKEDIVERMIEEI